MGKNYLKIVHERFEHISEKDFMTQVAQADAFLKEAFEEDAFLRDYLHNTDLWTNEGENNGTYNLFMTLITSGGAYEQDEELLSEEGKDLWVAESPVLEDGLTVTLNDNRSPYHQTEALYLLQRIAENNGTYADGSIKIKAKK